MSPHHEVSQLFQALSDPTRLEILAIVATSEACASDIHTRLGMSQPRVARHLKILVSTGLLAARRDGRFVRYAISEDSSRARLVRAALGLIPPRPAAGERIAQAVQGGLPAAHQSLAAPAPAAGLETIAEVEPPRPPMEDFLL
ncbi:MAG TPA: metalloregulator ArsR/SmtB family transcription factor [Candidatus Eisenbacteria bacterium]